ncbi:MAG: hypothetical protein NTV49_03930, partial [Kiritimatiellaeota bacterium]|nr:hypothetical protein [Kiritimatiellota bacterium]
RKVRVERARAGPGPFAALTTLPGSRREYGDRGLQDSTTYYYRLTAVVAGGGAGASTPVRESLTATPPAAVAGLAARSGEVRAVPLAWQPSPEPDVVRYLVYWSRTPAGPFALLASVPGRTAGGLVDDGKKSDRLGDAQTRYYKVRAVNAAGAESADSAAVSATTHGAPPAVQGLRAQSGLPRATRLVWEPSSDPTTTGYELQRSSRKADDFAALAKLSGRLATNYSDRGDAPAGAGLGALQDGMEYSYRVRAINVTEYPSPWAAPAAAQTKPLPLAPGKIQAAYGSGEVQLTWPAAPAGEKVRYRIWKKGERDPLGVTEQNSCVLRYGDVGRRTVISVTVVDADGLESPPGAAIELDECAPPIPQGLAAGSQGLREVVLQWKPPADNARSYRLERGDTPLGPFVAVAKVAPDVATYRDAGDTGAPLADLATYHYRLIALAANNRESGPSAVVPAETAPPPAPPAAVKIEAPAPRTVRVAWSAAPAEGVVKYQVERAGPEAPEKFIRVGEVEQLEFSEGGDAKTGLRDGSAYRYRIIAINRVGSSGAPSPPVVVTTQPPPAPPAAVKAEAPASRALRVTWTPSAALWVVKYIVERASAEQPEKFALVGEVEQPAFSEGGTAQTDLKDSAKYLYRITAVNRLGAAGAPSQPAEVVTRPPPAAVQGLTARGGEVRCVPLSWTASPESDVVRYELYRRDAPDGAWKLLTAVQGRDKTAWLDGGADPGNLADRQLYAYKLRAINAVTAASADSAVVEATTRGAPPAVVGVKVKSGQPREVSVAWEASADEKVVGYEVHRQAAGETNAVKIAETPGRERTTCGDRGGAGKSGLGTLADGAEYRYQVAAFNTAHVCSPLSEAVTARTKLAPAAPAVPDVTTNLPKAVKIIWRANPEADIRFYVLEAAKGADEKFREVARVETTAGDRLSYTEAGLPDGAPRCYRVKAVDRDTLESAWSAVADVGGPGVAGCAELQDLEEGAVQFRSHRHGDRHGGPPQQRPGAEEDQGDGQRRGCRRAGKRTQFRRGGDAARARAGGGEIRRILNHAWE